ncbi:MAG: FtsX-like permease family protein, partial [Lachnospiraceae bacterium]|nr:FtsX-like permease family protein [Lachnospiraceae bacterium]
GEQEGTLAQSKQAYEEGVAGLEQMRQTLAALPAQIQTGQQAYDALAAETAQAQTDYDGAAAALAAAQGNYDGAAADASAKRDAVVQLQTANAGLQGQMDDCSAQIVQLQDQQQAKQSELDASIAQKQSELSALEGQEDNEENQNKKAQLQSEIDSLNVQKTESYNEYQAQIDAQNNSILNFQAQMDTNLAAIPQAESDAAAAEGQAALFQTALAQAQAAADEKSAALAARQQALTAAAAELETAKQTEAALTAQIEALNQQLTDAKTQLESGSQALAAARTELDGKKAELAAAKAQLDAGWQQINDANAQMESGRQQLKTAKAQLDEGQKQIDQNRAELKAGQQQLAAAREKLVTGWQQLDSSKAVLEASRAQLSSGESQLAEGWQTLADSKAQVSDGEQKLSEAEDTIAENEKKLEDGWKEYQDGKQTARDQIKSADEKIAEAEQKLTDAQQKIADGEKEISEIEKPEWYISSRDVLSEYTGYGENADRMTNIGQVFPVLFFLVAALISLTTMTRMVEEERTQIGTMKALGYRKRDIASKYLKYALYATLGGSIFGVLVGEKLLPFIIINAYGIMYEHTPEIIIPYNWSFGLMAAGASLVCTLGAAWSASIHELNSAPAVLMRPPTPKEGKRVLLEYLPFLWKRLGFTWKSTVRNLLRYKKRFLMTVIGIGGCMGLLLVGFGLRDSIMDVAVLQYGQLQLYDEMIILDSGRTEGEQERLEETLAGDSRIGEFLKTFAQRITVTNGKQEYTPYLYVPESTEHLSDFMVFRDRTSKESYKLTDEGAIVTEKLAKMLNLKAGDKITISDDDLGKIEIPIVTIVENYLYHYVYLTPACYEKYYGKTVEYNSILLKEADGFTGNEQSIGTDLLAEDGVLNVTYTSTMAGQLDDMLGSLDVVIVVLIVSAGMLAFVVLYNLNNININERKRELATIKVLGFYDKEVDAYVYRENILLTIIGAMVGILFGIVLHRYIITTVEVDACMFGRNIKNISFVYGTLFTFGFSFFVNLVMHFKLKKIDMVESLKSVE